MYDILVACGARVRKQHRRRDLDEYALVRLLQTKVAK